MPIRHGTDRGGRLELSMFDDEGCLAVGFHFRPMSLHISPPIAMGCLVASSSSDRLIASDAFLGRGVFGAYCATS